MKIKFVVAPYNRYAKNAYNKNRSVEIIGARVGYFDYSPVLKLRSISEIQVYENPAVALNAATAWLKAA